MDAVLQAAAVSFGFVYIHPFEDGNGRVQRCLIHHILATRNFNPKGMIFPVSSVMLKRIDEYNKVLQAHSSPLTGDYRKGVKRKSLLCLAMMKQLNWKKS